MKRQKDEAKAAEEAKRMAEEGAEAVNEVEDGEADIEASKGEIEAKAAEAVENVVSTLNEAIDSGAAEAVLDAEMQILELIEKNKSRLPPINNGGGVVALTPAIRAATISEAGKILRQMLNKSK